MAAYVRLQLQNTKDELRDTTQTCTVRNNERALRISRAHVVKVREFSANNQKGGTAMQVDNS